MMPLIRIGPLALSSFGLSVLIAFWISMDVHAHVLKRAGVPVQGREWLPVTLFILGLIGARLWYALFNRDLYATQPRLLTQLSFGAFAFPGALLAGGIGLFIYARATHRTVLPWIDSAAQVLPWAQAVGMFGLLLSGEGYGRPTNLPWRIHLLGVDRHPTQIYEALALVLLGIRLWQSARRHPPTGEITARYLGGYGVIRLMLEPLRGDSLLLGSVRVAQVFGLLLVLGSVGWMVRTNLQLGTDRSQDRSMP